MAEVQKTSDVTARYAKLLIYGPAGHGKTVFIGSAQDDPRSSPVFLLDFEGGTGSIADKGIDVVRVKTVDDFETAYDLLTSDVGKKYRTVAIDSLSEIHTFLLLSLLSKKASADSRRHEDIAQREDYSQISIHLRRLVRFFRDLPMHVIMTANARNLEDPISQSVTTSPAMIGRFADELPGLFGLVTYLAIRAATENTPSERVLICEQTERYMAKVRVPPSVEFPPLIETPTFAKILDALSIPKPSQRSEKK